MQNPYVVVVRRNEKVELKLFRAKLSAPVRGTSWLDIEVTWVEIRYRILPFLVYWLGMQYYIPKNCCTFPVWLPP